VAEVNTLYRYDYMAVPANKIKLQNELRALNETETVRLDRKNRFLDHLLARFAEQFNDYALMLYSFTEEKAIADDILIKNKISFMKDYPFMSYYKARSFNYKAPLQVCTPDNTAGLTVRIRRLLGIPEFAAQFELYHESEAPFDKRWRMLNDDRKVLLKSVSVFSDPVMATAEKKMRDEIKKVRDAIRENTKYEVTEPLSGKFLLSLKDSAGNKIAEAPDFFASQLLAEAERNRIIKYATNIFSAEKIFIAEHLLLRPRYRPNEISPGHPGDTLLPICIKGNCELCGDEDPYSFRLTIIMNGEEGIANRGMEFRRFAEKTIRTEVPAHLGLKICWVDKEQLELFEPAFCAWLKLVSEEEPVKKDVSEALDKLIKIFIGLKNVYPPASLHDCEDGNDDNRVFLNQTIISEFKKP
jgi:hypothetical protein